MNCEGSAIVEDPEYPSDMPPKPSDSDRSDECETIEACIMQAAEEEGRDEGEEPSIDVAELAGPPGLPGPLYDPTPKDENGRPSWERLHALVVAVEALIGAGMVSEARPLLGQLRSITEAARGPSAKVIELGAERSRHRAR